MKCVTIASLCSVAAVLSACANSDSIGATQSFADDASDSFQAKMVDGGVSGRIVLQNPSGGSQTERQAQVLLSADFQIATVRIGTTTYTLSATPSGSGAADGGVYSDGDVTLTIMPFNTTTFRDEVQFQDIATGEFGLAIAGAETRPTALPSESVNYIGSWGIGTFDGAGAYTLTNSGEAEVDVDFAAVTDQVTMELRDMSTGLPVVGTLTASISDNGYSGTLTYDDGTLAGDLETRGIFFGPEADQIGGTLLGTVDTDPATGGTDVVGTFFGDQTP